MIRLVENSVQHFKDIECSLLSPKVCYNGIKLFYDETRKAFSRIYDIIAGCIFGRSYNLQKLLSTAFSLMNIKLKSVWTIVTKGTKIWAELKSARAAFNGSDFYNLGGSLARLIQFFI